ncbi:MULTISPECIES: class I SAM-dependent methyltransferase [unclassified Solwaraspora]|uniref:class I SAM-dependent methyltransferase n=1 Tax=unclassified Solwaraspora TaxID=2627926 RepID=UPI00248B927A|nr:MULTISPECIES: class I SAM-dependent methyltransferase [unclassified Solwaraspora]WBB98691.1 methyltransferase domain-containing protein [Solwaraspora sp. WMMA2059]WBC22756.1 methyltransferase domain-containing protein [Solwaraspora sp. WMMA2080]WJK35192.1 methyltransferase domain-containing protein [Solwaraspora sp. WMMA2065]
MSFELWNPATYDALRRQLIPSFDLLYGSASSAVQMSVPSRPQILDLGAGTGLLSAALLARIPDATITLIDHSERMLAQARQRFDGDGRASFAVQGLMDPLPTGPYDAVVSGLAIHHLEHHDKQALFGRLPAILRSGGIFVNVEQVLAPAPRLEEMYDRQHESHVHAAGTPADEWAAGRERMKHDICIDVETQLGWLRDAGFDTVDCLAKDWRFATYAGWLAP